MTSANPESGPRSLNVWTDRAGAWLTLCLHEADEIHDMRDDGPSRGSAVSALGAAALAVAVFLPGVGLTATGAAEAQQNLNAAAAQYGNATLQSEVAGVGASFNSLVGRQLGSVSGHQASSHIATLLIVLAALALLAALGSLAGIVRIARGQIALVGLVACACVLFRMISLPAAQGLPFALSLRWGIWLALAGAIAIAAGDLLWPAAGRGAEPSGLAMAKTWDELSGWTPEA